ncbi:MAG TPA: restriction endonuclease subunit S [Thermoanaerobaculia bacterium]|nr:restriction endonuclease subunit S [Thermoanaerobaculia bacterium]
MRIAVEELANIQTGYQPREGFEPSPEGTHLAIQAKDIDNENDHVLVVSHLDKIVATRDFSPYVVNNGEVLFLARGRRRSATLVEGLPAAIPAIAWYYFFILRLKTELVDPAFLAWVINEAEAQDYLEKVATGTGIPFVTKQFFGALKIELPPLEIQAQIIRLHRLGRRESFLRRQLERKRSELVRSVCRMLHHGQEQT